MCKHEKLRKIWTIQQKTHAIRKKGKTKQIRNNIKKIWLNLNHSTASISVFFIYICVCVYCVRCVLCPDGLNFTHKSTVYSNFQQFFFSLYAQRKSHNNTCDAVEKWTFQVNGNVKKWHGSSGFGFIDGFCCSVFGVLFFWPKFREWEKPKSKYVETNRHIWWAIYSMGILTNTFP